MMVRTSCTERVGCSLRRSLLLLPVLLTPLAAAPVVNGVVNGASFAAGGLAPGTIISIFGTGLARTTLEASTLPLPTSLDGTSVTVSGQPLPLFFVSPGQINAQLPFQLPNGPAQLTVRDSAGAIGSRSITVTSASPGVFSTTADGRGEAIAVHADFKPVRRAVLEYARTDETIILFCTGLGSVDTSVLSGTAAPSSPPARTTVTPTILMDGRPAQVTFSGLAPGFVGLYQINFVVPQGVGGDVVTAIRSGNATSNELTINVAGTYTLGENYSGLLAARA